jgi:antirestriction protein ArdC
MNTYQQFCENVTTQLFKVIDEKGSLLAWKKGWDDSFSSKLPLGVSGLYSGSNLFSLLIEQEKQRLPSNEWLTMKQVNKLGGKVKKGAKAQKVYFWKCKRSANSIYHSNLK